MIETSEVQFHAFVSKYTVQEDKIHGLWVQIQNEQAKLAVCLVVKQKQFTLLK